MAGYFGTEQQRSLQAKVEAASSWMKETPGACNPARLLGTDDPDRLGWKTILEILARDGVIGFRLISGAQADQAMKLLAGHGYRIDFWDVFMADRPAAERATSAVLAKGLPDGVRELPPLAGADPAEMEKLQSFMASNGIAPFSGSMLLGEFGPAITVRLAGADGELVAAAHGYFPHNGHSRHHRSAWGGLVAVSPDHRGKGLGNLANARMIASCLADLGAETVHELVSATNIASRRMVEASGLRLDPDLKSGIALSGGERFTR